MWGVDQMNWINFFPAISDYDPDHLQIFASIFPVAVTTCLNTSSKSTNKRLRHSTDGVDSP